MFIVLYHIEGDSPEIKAIDASTEDSARNVLSSYLSDEYADEDLVIEEGESFFIDSIEPLYSVLNSAIK